MTKGALQSRIIEFVVGPHLGQEQGKVEGPGWECCDRWLK